MNTLRFASPWLLLGLLLLPLLLRRRRSLGREGDAPALRFADTRPVRTNDRPPLRVRLRNLPHGLRLAALALVIVAMARPQTGSTQEVIEGDGVDIVVALDISGSMAALDFEPENRLEAAREVIRDFVQRRDFDRIGLVVFARTAFDQSPPTVDHVVLERQLDQIDLAPKLGVQDGTAVGLGLANAAAMLESSEVESRVVILLTDGANNAGEIDPLTAATAAEALGIRVYTIGMGRPGQVPVPVDSFFGQRMAYIESDLDEETLQGIAEATGGRYYRATNAEGLASIYAEIDALEQSEVEVRSWARYRELAAFLLWPAALLLAVDLGLRTTWLRRLP
jgi:Ca-activated chloride channel family protein